MRPKFTRVEGADIVTQSMEFTVPMNEPLESSPHYTAPCKMRCAALAVAAV